MKQLGVALSAAAPLCPVPSGARAFLLPAACPSALPGRFLAVPPKGAGLPRPPPPAPEAALLYAPPPGTEHGTSQWEETSLPDGDGSINPGRSPRSALAGLGGEPGPEQGRGGCWGWSSGPPRGSPAVSTTVSAPPARTAPSPPPAPHPARPASVWARMWSWTRGHARTEKRRWKTRPSWSPVPAAPVPPNKRNERLHAA